MDVVQKYWSECRMSDLFVCNIRLDQIIWFHLILVLYRSNLSFRLRRQYVSYWRSNSNFWLCASSAMKCAWCQIFFPSLCSWIVPTSKAHLGNTSSALSLHFTSDTILFGCGCSTRNLLISSPFHPRAVVMSILAWASLSVGSIG